MKKAWQDVKSFVTILLAIAFVVFTYMRIITGEQFYSIFQVVIAFYFGTQFEKIKQLKEELDKKENIDKEVG